MSLSQESALPRLLLDANVLIAAAYNPHSASAGIVKLVERQRLRLIISPAIRREYERLIPKAVRSREKRDWIWRILDLAENVTPEETPAAVTEDSDDDKFLAAAVAGQAAAIVSNDEHLLAMHPYQGIDILRPRAFWDQLDGTADSSA
jgi:uncharacterized protein